MLPVTGRHYWVVDLKDSDTSLQACCSVLGFVDASVISLPPSIPWESELARTLVSAQGPGTGNRTHNSTGGVEHALIGVAFDAGAHTAAVWLHKSPWKGPLFLSNIPSFARFIIHGRKHRVAAELRGPRADDAVDAPPQVGQGVKRGRE